MAATKNGYAQILVGFERTSPRPLELNTVFDSYDEALNYAKYNPTSYVGQILSVEGKVYVIVNDNNIKSLDRIVTTESTNEIRTTQYIYSDVDQVILEHNLGYTPEVIFLDQLGNRTYPLIEYLDSNTIKLSWNGNRSGSFYLI